MQTHPRLLLPLSFLILFGVALASGVPPRAPQDLQTHAVAGSVSYLRGGGGNIGLSVGEDGVLMIDDQFARTAPSIRGAIERLSGAEEGPVFLVNTHWHGDHTGGNAEFAETATIVAHTNVRRRLAGDPTIEGRTETRPAAALPVITYEDGVSIHFNGEEVRLIHVPSAHTDGDTVVWFTGSNVLHLGDLYFQLGYPFIDLSSGGNALGLIEGLRGLVERIPEDAHLIPGHGEATGLEGLRDYLAMIETVTERVRAGKEEGKSVQDLLAAGITDEFEERWGGFEFVPKERFVQSIYESLDR